MSDQNPYTPHPQGPPNPQGPQGPPPPPPGAPPAPPSVPGYGGGAQDGGFGYGAAPQGFGQTYQGAGTPPVQAKGFFGALFDFSFTHFVTPSLVKVVYIAVLVMGILGWLVYVVAGFSVDPALGVLALILGPIVVIIYLALVRLSLEFYLAVVRMSQDIHHRLPR